MPRGLHGLTKARRCAGELLPNGRGAVGSRQGLRSPLPGVASDDAVAHQVVYLLAAHPEDLPIHVVVVLSVVRAVPIREAALVRRRVAEPSRRGLRPPGPDLGLLEL